MMMKPVRNAPSTVPTSLRFIASRLAHRVKRSGQAGPDLSRVMAALSSLSDHVLRCDKVAVSAKHADWLDAGLNLRAGAAVTLIASGKVFASRPLDVAFGPQVGLWYRVGSGAANKIVGHASTFLVESGGRLDLVAKPPGEFLDRDGTFDPQEKRAALRICGHHHSMARRPGPCASSSGRGLSRLVQRGLVPFAATQASATRMALSLATRARRDLLARCS